MKIFIPILLLFLFACNSSTTDVKADLRAEIASLSQKDTSALVLKEKYQAYNSKYPKDSINAVYLLELARYYQSETEAIDTARIYAKKVFTDFNNSKSAPEAMLMYATLQDELSEFIHWSKKTQKTYPKSRSGEYALLNLAIQLDNRQQYDEALKYYEEYLAVYPNGERKKDVEFSIKNLGKLDEFIKNAEKNN